MNYRRFVPLWLLLLSYTVNSFGRRAGQERTRIFREEDSTRAGQALLTNVISRSRKKSAEICCWIRARGFAREAIRVMQ